MSAKDAIAALEARLREPGFREKLARACRLELLRRAALRWREPESRPLRRRCRFRIGQHRQMWPASSIGGYLSGEPGPVRLLGGGSLGDRTFVARELWWAGYSPPSESLTHVEVAR